MSVPNATTTTVESTSSDEVAAKAVHKRFEGLVMVRTKAIKGKGAWYWSHLEPVLVHNSDTGLAKAVKLKCSLCDSVFSASNPSRTASEHLKRGTCRNFASAPKPISSIMPPPPLSSPAASPTTQRKRRVGSSGGSGNSAGGGIGVPPLAVVDPSRFGGSGSGSTSVSVVNVTSSSSPSNVYGVGLSRYHQNQQSQHLVLSGGKEDLGALAMLEDSVKRLKSPKSSPGPILNKAQVDAAFDFLADWAYECCRSMSFSNIEHPKFKSFLNQVGLPGISKRDLLGSRLDVKYEEMRAESEAKIRDAMFFQIVSDGWKCGKNLGDDRFVCLSLNLPNGNIVFRKAVFVSGYVPEKYAEEILWDAVMEICGNTVKQCVGIISDKFKSTALRNLEDQHHWMVNLCCQYQGFNSLIKDFRKELPLFKNVTVNCFKLANFVNNNSHVRHSFHKYQLQEYGRAGLLRVPFRGSERSDFGLVHSMVEDVLTSARALHLLLLDESFKAIMVEEPIAREIEEMMRNPHFWREVESVLSLVKLVKAMAQEIESDTPRIGQCLPLWEELRIKVKEWCSKYQIVEGPVDKIIDARFKKNYHPSWAAAFVLDPLYLVRDNTGKYLPPFKCLESEQEKDVDRLITRLVSREEAHIALMELMKWRTEGLDPFYAQAVQLKQRDPNTGKMKLANPQSSRLVWETHLNEFKLLGKVAVRLIFLHATSCGFRRNSPLLKWASAQAHSRIGIERAQKLLFISANSSKVEKRDDEEKELELFALANGEDDHVLNEVFVDTSSASI